VSPGYMHEHTLSDALHCVSCRRLAAQTLSTATQSSRAEKWQITANVRQIAVYFGDAPSVPYVQATLQLS